MVSCVDQPGAVTSWRVEVWVVWRTEGAVEVPQPLSTRRKVTVNLITEVLEENKMSNPAGRRSDEVTIGVMLLHVAIYLAINAAITAQAVRQAGVDPGVAGQAGKLIEAAGLK